MNSEGSTERSGDRSIIKQAQDLLDPYDVLYDMVSEGDYDYLLQYCKNGQEYINAIKKIKEAMYKHFFVGAVLAVISGEIK